MRPTDGASRAFDLLDRRVQKWIWDENWRELHDIQERAIPAILAADRDVLIAAATAGGKTEAAFLPAVSSAAQSDIGGLSILYVSPLKALINDQFRRLETLLERVDLPAYRWHGDVSASHKKKLMLEPSGALLITPESLEAIFIRRGPETRRLFLGLRYVVVDELHAFLGTERGRQLQSLLVRVERACGRRVARIALSATLGDMRLAAEALRPGEGEAVECIVSESEGQEVHLQIRGYEVQAPRIDPEQAPLHTPLEDTTDGDVLAIAEHLYQTLRGGRHIVFANRRADVERFTDLLSRRCKKERLPNEFWPHHGSLSRALREDAEAALRDGEKPSTVIATTTLELGIDVGSVETIGQIGAPPSVSAVRQRLGRSGRRGDPAVIRIYVQEGAVEAQSEPHEELRATLVQSIATVRLLARRWYEPPSPDALHLSTLVQQILSRIAECGGVRAQATFELLCVEGPFRRVREEQFAQLLRDLAEHDLLVQMQTGVLILGGVGERLVNHHDFYAAFSSPDEYRLVAEGRTLGTLPILYPINVGFHLIFGGRRWTVVAVDEPKKVIELVPSQGGQPPRFHGSCALVHSRVREEMRAVYEENEPPAFIDPGASNLLVQAREAWRRFDLGRRSILDVGGTCFIFPWTGDREMNTILLHLRSRDFNASQEGVAIRVDKTDRRALLRGLESVRKMDTADALKLAGHAAALQNEKHHPYMSTELLTADYASRMLDIVAAACAVESLLAREGPSTSSARDAGEEWP